MWFEQENGVKCAHLLVLVLRENNSFAHFLKKKKRKEEA